MAYTPHTEADIHEMLAVIGAKSLDELFADVPQDLVRKQPLAFPSLDELSLTRHFEALAAKNRAVAPGQLFLGAGAYNHFTPAAVKAVVMRGEFLTSYTPYQAEVSQGTLQAIYEWQSHICALTGMDVSNASMYDGATALAEGVLMAARHNGGSIAYLPRTLHPAYRAVVETHCRYIDVEVRELALDSKTGATTYPQPVEGEKVAAVVLHAPNFFGVIEDPAPARAFADKCKALLVACCNPTALAVIAAPGDFGADIAVGEAQPLGIPLSFGGPYAGFLACKRDLIRKMPGRLVGRTTDEKGNEGFVLTLQAREQHIRREKATSNICTNQGLFALMATIYMTAMGKQGLVDVAETSAARMRQLEALLVEKTDAEPLFPGAPTLHEMAFRLPIPARVFLKRLRDDAGIVGGYDLGEFGAEYENAVLVCTTEQNSAADVERYAEAAARALAKEMVG